MKIIKTYLIRLTVLAVVIFTSCKDLTEVNENPNGVDPETVHPNLMMTTVMTAVGQQYVNDGFDRLSGVMQQTQKDSWSGGHNDYEWSGESWGGYFGTLRNAKHAYDRAVELDLPFHQGVLKILMDITWATITDFWGDVPYTNALNGDEGGEENIHPQFDSQEKVYKGVIADLKEANQLLSADPASYQEIYQDGDIFYHGDVRKWRKLANSLLLRYYMRLSEKDEAFAKNGINEILTNPGQFPIFESNDDDFNMGFIGSSNSDSWPGNQTFDPNGSNFRRKKMCETFVDKLLSLNDPRIDVWCARVEIPIKISYDQAPVADVVVDGVRYLNPDSLTSGGRMIHVLDPAYLNPDSLAKWTMVDTTSTYVGIPPSMGSEPYWYNLNPNPEQGGSNVHVSYLADIYREASGPLLLSRVMTYAEVEFILAEAAQRGWTSDAKTHYENAVRASMDVWGVGGDYDAYIANPDVAYDGTLERIMEQKWISFWTGAHQSWFDYRRTGLPALKAGPFAKRQVLPIRLQYGTDERDRNFDQYQAALSGLEVTNYSREDGEDSPWSKFWLLQGTNNPW